MNEMNPIVIRTQFEHAVINLAATAEDQRAYLEQNGFAPEADELAIALADLMPMVEGLRVAGVLTDMQVAALRAIDDHLTSFSGERNARLWHVDWLERAPQWAQARALAREALSTLQFGF